MPSEIEDALKDCREMVRDFARTEIAPHIKEWDEKSHFPMEIAREEGVMAPDDLARIAVTIAALPAEVNMLETIVLPVSMPFVGRG